MDEFNKPLSGLVTPRFGAIATFMRMPHVLLEDATGIDIGLVGIPWDGGTTNRPGPRHGPRQMRDMSSMVRPMHQISHVVPSKLANIADLGDCPVNPADVMDGLKRVETYFKKLVAKGIRPLSAGGDHLCSLPVLRAVGEKQPVGMIHFDAHSDLWPDDDYDRIDHGTMFYKAVKSGLVDPKRSVQIGIRTTTEDYLGVNVITAREVHEKGTAWAVAKAKEIVGDASTYVTFDIDALDPAFAPGTGTPVWGGLASWQAAAMLRDLAGINMVGGDVVEVSPPYDTTGATAIAGAHVAYELVCLYHWARTQR